VALGACVLMYMPTGERKYLRYAWQTFKYALFLFVLMLVLFFGEQLLVLA
jgi:hypothetical protein